MGIADNQRPSPSVGRVACGVFIGLFLFFVALPVVLVLALYVISEMGKDYGWWENKPATFAPATQRR